MTTKKITKAKIAVWFVTLLFVGSSIGMALFYKTPYQSLEIPKKFVNDERPSQEQINYLLDRNIAVLLFYHDAQCLQCYDLLEEYAKRLSSLYPYLIIYYIESNQTKIELLTANNSTIITQGNAEDILAFVCEAGVNAPACIDYFASRR